MTYYSSFRVFALFRRQWSGHRLWSQAVWVWIPALPLTTYVILDKFLKFSVSQVFHVWNGDNNDYFISLLWGLLEIVYKCVKCLDQCLVHCECCVSVGFSPMYTNIPQLNLHVTNKLKWMSVFANVLHSKCNE